MSQDDSTLRAVPSLQPTEAELDKSSFEHLYQRLAELVTINLNCPEALFDHIAGRPPGVCNPVSE
jgi:hypothetical protein